MDLFKGIEKKTGVKMDEIMKLVNSFQGTNLQDEKKLRELVQKVGALAKKKVPKSTEDKIVDTLVKNKQKPDATTISKMLNEQKRKEK